MYLLDTNICIAIIKTNPQAIEQFNYKFSECYISSVVLAELYKGAYCSQKIHENINNLNKLMNLLPVREFDQKAAIEFGQIQAQLRKIGKPTGELDAMIAAVARSRQDVLVTNNTRHFINISDLNLENWLLPSNNHD